VLGRDRVSQRRACRILGQCRSTQRRTSAVPDDEPHLVARTVELACDYGRYAYRRATGLLRVEGFAVNHKRVERLWRREGLSVPARHPKHAIARVSDEEIGTLSLTDGREIRTSSDFANNANFAEEGRWEVAMATRQRLRDAMHQKPPEI
jgi:hypothetical protein